MCRIRAMEKCRTMTVLAIAVFCLVSEGWAQDTGFDPFRAGKPGHEQRRITNVEFVDTPITTLFKMVSDLTGQSIIMSPEVSSKPPRVNIWIKDLSPDETLEKIASISELILEREGNTIKVFRFGEYARIYGLDKQIVNLKHAAAADVVAVLNPFVPKELRSQVLADTVSNRIVLLAPKRQLGSFLKLIQALDVADEEDAVKIVPLIHARVSAVLPVLQEFLSGLQGGPARPLGNAAKTGATRAGADNALHFTAEQRLNLILVRGRQDHVAKALELIERLDVSLETTIVNYEVTYANASDIAGALEGRVSKGRLARQPQTPPSFHVYVSEHNNQIVVEGSPADHERSAALIAAFDRPIPLGTGGIRIYRLDNTTASEVARIITSLVNEDAGQARRPAVNSSPRKSHIPGRQGLRAVGSLLGSEQKPPATGVAASTALNRSAATAAMGDGMLPHITEAPEINAVIIRASASEHEELAKIIKELDEPRDQVILELTLVTVRSDEGFDLGIELGGAGLGGKGVQTVGFTHLGIGTVDPATGATRIAASVPSGLNFLVFNSDDYSLVLNALETVGHTRITSSPKVLAEDNAQVLISQLNSEPYEVISQGETTTTTTFGGFVEAGTTLTATPHLSKQNWLKLEYAVNLSSFGSRTSPNLPPARLENRIEGTVRIPEGHIIMLGGLVSSREETIVQRVPLLSQIPLVGELFKNRSKVNVNETLFVFIRPTILRDPAFKDLMYMSEMDLKKAKLSRQAYPQNCLKRLTSSAAIDGGQDS